MARVVIQNALFFGRKRASALVIPWTTYTEPEVAHVGLYERQARERGIDVATFTVPLHEVDRALLDGDAGEMIGEMSLAITAGLSLGDVSRTIRPYPTQAEAWKRVGDAWNRTRLTPSVRRVFER